MFPSQRPNVIAVQGNYNIFIARIIRRREDNIKSDLKDRGKEGMNSIQVDQDRSKNQTVANTVRIFMFQIIRKIS